MTLLLALCALVAVALVIALVVALVLASDRRNLVLTRYVADEHDRTLDVCRQCVGFIETFGNKVMDAALRETEDTRTVIDALIADRRYLVTAIVATNTDPRAAQRLGLVAQADAAAHQPRPGREDYLEELRDMARGVSRDSETVDADGHPIVPVGMGG